LNGFEIGEVEGLHIELGIRELIVIFFDDLLIRILFHHCENVVVIVLHILLDMIKFSAELMEYFLKLKFIFQGVFELFIEYFFFTQNDRFNVLKNLIIQITRILLN
jgi:hypothetical protein